MPSPFAATPEEMRALIAGRRSDDPTWFSYGDATVDPEYVVKVLEGHISERRRYEMERVLGGRTRNVAVVVDGMVDLGNVSAIMRSAEAFGVQNVHAIDTSEAFKRSRRTTRGADKWIDRYAWEDPDGCLDYLDEQGYRVLVADAGPEARFISDVDLTGRIAVVFGNEREGISQPVRDRSFDTIRIPMEGFVESLNVSVAASIVLAEVHRQRTLRYGGNGDLTLADRDRIRAVWYLKSVRGSGEVVARALADQ
ncbi:MAG: RNA methyltransferase [Actinomycetota bacterium]